jgi:hypothetical protein
LTLSFVPDVEQRLWRTVMRRKYQLTRNRVQLQNRLEGLLEEAHRKTTRSRWSKSSSKNFGWAYITDESRTACGRSFTQHALVNDGILNGPGPTATNSCSDNRKCPCQESILVRAVDEIGFPFPVNEIREKDEM